ncbi:insulinase family protein [Candidatus Kaiserbacteria bacterium]|nr:insulinase family protein [Candidatus Kaiserbacteria bacterium]
MIKKIDRQISYSLATIEVDQSDTATVLITADLQQKRTLQTQATEEIYADMLMSGCGNYTRDEFLDAVNKLGATLSVSINNCLLSITLKSSSQNFKKLLKLTELMLNQPTFSQSELKRAVKTTSNELKHAKEDSKTIALIGLQNTIYSPGDRHHTFSIDSTLAALTKVSKSDLQQFHNDVMASFLIVSVAGDKNICKETTGTLKKLKKVSKVKKKKQYQSQKSVKSSVKLTNIPSRTNIDFSLGLPIPINLHHPDYIPLSFGIAVLGKWGGFAGRLMSTVRELEGLTYNIYAQTEGFINDESGYLHITTFFAPDKAVEGLSSTHRELKKLYNKGISTAELKKFKTIINTSQTLLNDSTSSQLRDLHSYHQFGFSLEEIAEHKRKVEKLTVSEVNQAIKKYLNPKHLIISGAGPTKAVEQQINKVCP